MNYSPTISEFCVANGFSREQVLDAAQQVGGNVLRNGRILTPATFAVRILDAAHVQAQREDPNSTKYEPPLTDRQRLHIKQYGGCSYGGRPEFRSPKYREVQIMLGYEPGYFGTTTPWRVVVFTGRSGRQTGNLGRTEHLCKDFTVRGAAERYMDSLVTKLSAGTEA